MSIGFGNIARNDLARAFIFANGVYKCAEQGRYADCVMVDALDHSRGDITRIECPSPLQYGVYDEIGSIPGEISRLTTTLTGRMSRNSVSEFYQLFLRGCSFDLHLHFGLCTQPNNFDQFDKALIFEDVQVTNFSTDPLMALQSSDRAVINESIDVSVGRFYEVVNLQYGTQGAAVTTDGPILSTAICDRMSCGADCENGSDGCSRMFAIADDDSGEDTVGIFYYSDDGGTTWTRLPIADGAANNPEAVLDVACWGDNVIVLDNDNTLWVINRDDLFDGTSTVFTQVLTAFDGTSETATALATSMNNVGVIVGTGGHIAYLNDLTGSSILVDAGFATSEDLNDVYIGVNGVAVAVGDAGAVVWSRDGIVWYTATAPAAIVLTAVLVKSDTNWLVGGENGALYCTENSGRTWTQLTYPGASATDAVTDLDLATSHVIYMTAGTRLYRSIDGGARWVIEPNIARTPFVTNAGLNSVTACYWNPNFVLVGGEAAGGTGLLVRGLPAS